MSLLENKIKTLQESVGGLLVSLLTGRIFQKYKMIVRNRVVQDLDSRSAGLMVPGVFIKITNIQKTDDDLKIFFCKKIS